VVVLWWRPWANPTTRIAGVLLPLLPELHLLGKNGPALLAILRSPPLLLCCCTRLLSPRRTI
jgi:hypothetical protein